MDVIIKKWGAIPGNNFFGIGNFFYRPKFSVMFYRFNSKMRTFTDLIFAPLSLSFI